jgi:hypothetical protein
MKPETGTQNRTTRYLKELEPHMNETPKETSSGETPAERKKALFLWL